MNKLYILVDETLSSGQKMSQAAHAVAEFMIKRPRVWHNEIIVILDATRQIIHDITSYTSIDAVPFTDDYYKYPRALALMDT